MSGEVGGTVTDAVQASPAQSTDDAPRRRRRTSQVGVVVGAVAIGCVGFGAAYLLARPHVSSRPAPSTIVLNNPASSAVVISTPPLSGAVPALARPVTRPAAARPVYTPPRAPAPARTTTPKPTPTTVYATTTFR